MRSNVVKLQTHARKKNRKEKKEERKKGVFFESLAEADIEAYHMI
jgi:hypothetical protein